MQAGVPAKLLIRSPRARLLAAAALASGILLAGCGGSPGSSTVAAVHTTTASTPPAAGAATPSSSSTTAADGAASSSPSSPAAPDADALAFAKCMRAHGVPDFPDPTAGGGFLFRTGSGVNPSSPAFMTAQAKCQKLMPGIRPGMQTHPSTQELSQMLKVAQCMRRHGVSNFPDPRTSVPSNPRAAVGGHGVISAIDGVILVFPATINEQSPSFTHAAAACAFPLHNH
jgi:hypothetical protein